MLNLNEDRGRKKIKRGNNRRPTATGTHETQTGPGCNPLMPIKNRQQPTRGRENEDDVVLKDKLFEGEYRRKHNTDKTWLQ